MIRKGKTPKMPKMADERDPAERVRKLVQFAGQVHVDNSIAPKKYFRSGIEMEKMVSCVSFLACMLYRVYNLSFINKGLRF